MYVKIMKNENGNTYYEKISAQFIVDKNDYFFKSDNYCQQRNLLNVLVYCNYIKHIINNTPAKFGVIALPEVFCEDFKRMEDIIKYSNINVVFPSVASKRIKNESSDEYYCLSIEETKLLLNLIEEVMNEATNMIDTELKDGLYAVYNHGKIYYCLASYIAQSNPELKNTSFILVDENEDDTDSIIFDFVGTTEPDSIDKKIWSVYDCINNIVVEMISY